MPRVLLHIALLATVVLAGPWAWAQSGSQAQAQIDAERARHRYLQAEANHGAVANLLLRTRQRIQDLTRLRTTLPRDIANANADAAQLVEKATAAEKKVPTLKADLTRAENDHAQRLVTSRASKAELLKAAANLEEAKKGALADFEASTAWRELGERVTQAEAAITEASEAILTALMTKPDYRAQVAAANAAETNVKAMRESGRSDALPAASRNWMDAKNAVEQTRKRALDGDPALAEARKKLVVLKQQQADARAKFDAELARLPQVDAAAEVVAAKKKTADADAAQVSTAEREANILRQALSATTRSLAGLKEQSRTALSEVDRLGREQQGLASSLQSAQSELGRLQSDEQRLRQELQRAQDHYQSVGTPQVSLPPAQQPAQQQPPPQQQQPSRQPQPPERGVRGGR